MVSEKMVKVREISNALTFSFHRDTLKAMFGKEVGPRIQVRTEGHFIQYSVPVGCGVAQLV